MTAEFPNSIFVPRTMVNRNGAVYDETKTKVIYAEDLNKPNDEIVAVENFLQNSYGYFLMSETFIFVSSFVLRFSGNANLKYQIGDKIKFTNGGVVKYYTIFFIDFYSIVTKNTLVTLFGDVAIDNSAITEAYYSRFFAPVSFPQNKLAYDQSNGWFSFYVPTLQSSDAPNYVLRFAYDVTAIIGLGYRVKFTQNGSVKYGIVHAVSSYSGGVTDVTVFCGTDYTISDTNTYPLTLFYFSNIKAPFGFPLSPLKWCVKFTHNTNVSQSNPIQNQKYNLGSFNFTFPIGVWNFTGRYFPYAIRLSDGQADMFVSLSSSLSAESDAELTTHSATAVDATGVTQVAGGCTVFVSKCLTFTTKTVYYLINWTANTGVSLLYLVNANSKLVLCATSAYL